MLGNLSLEGVVVEVRPASMVDKHVQHVVGIHTQGTYTSTIAYSIFRSVPPPPPPPPGIYRANWRVAALLHLSKANLCRGLRWCWSCRLDLCWGWVRFFLWCWRGRGGLCLCRCIVLGLWGKRPSPPKQ